MLRINFLAVMCLGLLIACGPGESGGTGARSEEAVGQVRAASLSTSSLAFGDQQRGTTSSALTVRITNNSSSNQDCDLTISGPFKLLNGSNLVSIWNNARVSGNSFTDIPVKFLPTTVGSASGSITMANCPPGGTVTVSGTGTSSASVAPASLTFDSQKTGTISQQKSVVVSNSSTAFNITAISATGDFEVTDPNPTPTTGAPVTVPAATAGPPAVNGTKTISVRYKPTTTGSSTGTLTITTDEPSTLTVSLSGSKVALATQVSPTTIPSFGEQRLNVTSAPSSTTVTVRNAGDTNLNITALSTTGPFALVSPPTTPLVLAAGATSQPLQVTFTPTDEGDVTGALNITTDETSVPVSLSGKGVKPNLVLTPTGPVAFGDQRVTTSVTKTVTVSNTGSGPIAISSITKAGAAAFTFTSTLNAPFTLAAGAAVSLSVTFQPGSEGDAVGAITLATSDADFSPGFVVDLSGKGVKPNLQLDVSPLDFGDVRVNATSTKPVKVTNIGTGPITISSVAKSGHTAYSLVSGPTTPFTLNPGDSQTFSVKYSPTSVSASTDTGSLALANTDVGYTPSFAINFTGRGVKPVIGVSPNPLAFGELRVNTVDTKPVTVNNTGNGSITITGITQSGSSAFTLVSPPATPFTIGASSAQGLSVKFSPTTETAESGTLTLATSDPDYPAGIVINLSGTGINPSLFLDPTPLAFNDVRVGTSSTKTVTLKNNGTGTIYITSLGTSGAPYSLVSPPGTPFSLTGGASTTLSVKYNPTVETAAGGTDTGTLSVTGGSNFGTTWTTATASLTGRGVKPNLSLNPSPLAFGDVRVSTTPTKTLTVKNTGSGPITISNITKSGTLFALVSPPATPFTLNAGAEQPLAVKYSPTVESTLADSGSVTVTSTDTDFPSLTANLSGKGVKPNLVLDPTPLAFGDVRLDTESPKTLTIRNTGSGSINITEIAKSANPVFTLDPPPATPYNLAAGATTTLTVRFKPTALLTAESATLTVATDDPDFPTRSSSLTGRGVKPNLVLDASALPFGEVRVGTNTTKPLKVSNTGSGPITISSLSTGTGSPFSLVSPPATPFTVAAGTDTTLTVKFSPTAEASSTGTLTLTTQDADWPSVTVSLSGQGVRPNLVLDPNPLAFGDVHVGNELTKLVAVKNTGTGPITLSSFSTGSSSLFTLVSPPATPLPLAAGASTTLSVKFSPVVEASASGSLTITTQDSEWASATVSLTGRGVKPTISIDPSPVAFGDVRVDTVSTKTVTVSNTGSASIVITSISKTGSSLFTLASAPSTPLTLGAGSSTTLTVTFSPVVEATTPDTGLITFATEDPGLPSIALNLSGRGVRPNLGLSPNPLAFGDVRVGTNTTKTVTVSNTGSGPITISDLSTGAGSPFSLVSPPATPFSVGAGTTTTLTVKFSPTADASATGTLTLTSSDSAFGSATVDLTGRGVRPNVVIDPNPLDFGKQVVGDASVTQTLTVRNTGTGPVRINSMSINPVGVFSIVSSTAGFNLAAGDSSDIQVRFTPTSKTNYSATLNLTTDEAVSTAAPVSLRGEGASSLKVDPADLIDFGEVAKGLPVTKTITLTNQSDVSIGSLSVTSLTGVFGSTQPLATTLTTRGSTTTFTVTFRPDNEGPFSTALTLSSTASNGPHSFTIKGTGVVPVAMLSLPVADAAPISAYDFAGVRVNSTTQATVRLTNTGKAPLTFSEKPSLSGSTDAGTSVFSYLGPDAITIEPNAHIDFQIAFQPAAKINYSNTLTIKSNASNSPTVLSLTGFGADPELQLDRTSVFFGDVRVGSRSTPVPVTINNTGNAPVKLTSLPVAGPFEVSETDGGTVVLPKTITVRGNYTFATVYRPTAEAAETGSVTITTDMTQTADAGTLMVALSGNGTTSRLATSVNSLDFGAQRVMRTSGVLPVVLTNPGRADLSITNFIFSNPAFNVSPASPVSMPLTIPAGQQVPISLVFTPSTLGAATGQFFIISNAANSADAGTLSLAGRGTDGQLTLTPSVVSFDGDGGVEVGAGAQQTVTITNTGEAALTITGMDPLDGGVFTVSGLPTTGQTDAGVILQRDGTWSITVTFTPEQRGYVSTSAIIRSDSVISPAYNMLLRGTGVAAAVELLPSDFYFGKSNVGVSTSQDISIKNVGERDLYVSNISFVDVDGGVTDGGTSAALDFSIGSGGDAGTTGFTSIVVAPGRSTLVPVKFTPQETGVRRAKALVFTNDKVAEANLTGEGVSPNLALLPSAELDFKSVVVNKPSAPRILTLKNTGSGPLTVSTLTVGGADSTAFILTPPTLPITLQPGASTDVSVQLKPDAERQFTGQLVIKSNDPDAPSVTVPMFGTGVRQQIQLSKSALEFGQQLINNTSQPRKVLVTNSSDTNVTLTALTVEGTGNSQFTLPSLALPLVLPPGKDVEVGLTFTPLDAVDVNCALKIAFSDLAQPLSVTLHGKGISSVLAIAPSPLDFGGVRVGSGKREQPLTITNLSSDPIVLAAPEVTYNTGEPFTYDSASLSGRELAPSMSVIVSVGYQPTVETLSETTLSFGTTTPQKPRSLDVTLKGRATKRLLFVDQDSLDFGFVPVNKTVDPKEIVITNKSAQQQRVVVMLKTTEGSPFTLGTKALADAIPAGGTATFTVAFDPDKAGEASNDVQVYLQGESDPEVVIPVKGVGRAVTGGGGGCSCDSTEAAGSAGLMMLLALVGSRRRRRQ